MPLPLILAVPALIGLAGYGAKKGLNARRDNKAARRTRSEANQIQKGAEQSLTTNRQQTTKSLEKLGLLKLELWENELARFVDLFEQIKRVELSGASQAQGLTSTSFIRNELGKMKTVSTFAKEALSGGATAIGTGALVGIAGYGGTTMFAAASTGTAISSLSGVAATNATLAWLGGGSLAAGGFGMAGGVAVLGGIVAAPVIALGGHFLAAQARKNLAEAKAHKATAKKAAAELKSASAVLRGIRKVSVKYTQLLSELKPRFSEVVDELEQTIDTHGFDYSAYPDTAKNKVYLAVQFAMCMKTVIDTPIMNQSGALSPKYKHGLEKGGSFLKALQ